MLQRPVDFIPNGIPPWLAFSYQAYLSNLPSLVPVVEEFNELILFFSAIEIRSAFFYFYADLETAMNPTFVVQALFEQSLIKS